MSKKKENEPLNPTESACETACGAAANEAAGENAAETLENDLQHDLDTAKRELDDAKDRFLRLAAEYDNFRKRTTKERETLYGDASASTVTSFLPVLDNLERAAREACADEAYKKGIELILKQLLEILGKMNVAEIEALGKAFDPNLHNAVMHIEDDSLGESVVAEVLQKGYIMGERMLRHAIVKVAN